jgi:hypothetical protein
VSVIVPTRSAWPAVAPVIDALGPQIVAMDAELIVVDGTEDGDAVDRRTAHIPCEGIRVSHVPGSDIFELRARGLIEGSGKIVAMTEDHCIPAPTYLAAVLQAHAQHAEQAVAGAVVNGSTERWIDRVNFLVVHARNLPPRDSLPGSGWIPTASNISYKREELPTHVPERGWLETVHNVALLQSNQVVFDDRIVVRHVQSTGVLGTFRNHFHAGKSMGGLARSAIGSRPAQLRWALQSALGMPPRFLRPVWELGQRSPSSRRSVVPLLPFVAALSTADAVGLVCGVLVGAGRSTDLVQ